MKTILNFIKTLFWNQEENRVRSAYRITIQLTLFFFLMKGLGALMGIPGEINGNLPLVVYLSVAAVRLLRVLISVWLSGRFLDRRSFSDFGLKLDRGWWQDLVFGLVLGTVMIGGVFLIELSQGWIEVTWSFKSLADLANKALPLLVFIILFICVGFSEELLYRGYVLRNLAEGFKGKRISPIIALLIGLILSSVLFGVFHLGGPHANTFSTINIMIFGLLFGMTFILSGRIAIPVGLHISWNLFQGNVFGFPVSGTTFSADTFSFFTISQTGPVLWTGGAYGPEGGLLGLCALLAGILMIMAWIRIRTGKLEFSHRLTRPTLIKNEHDQQ